MRFRPKWFAFLCILAAGVAAAIAWWPKPPIVLASGTLLEPAGALADFSLIDNQGRSFGQQNLQGHWSLLFFGYTNCPDYCPTTLVTLAALEKQLRAAKTVAPQVIFISVDAKRDTPARLNRFVPNFDPEFVGLTASGQAAIEAIAKKWGVAVKILPGPDGNYIVDHSSVIFVVDPAGRLAAILTGPFSVDALKSDFQRIVTAGA